MRSVFRFSTTVLAFAVAAAICPFAARSQTTAPSTQPQQQQRSPFRSAGDQRFEGRGVGGDAIRQSPPQQRMEWRRGDVGAEYPVGRGRGGGSGDPSDAEFEEPTPEQWNDIEAFMKKYSPNRLERMSEIADEERQEAVKKMLTLRYRAMKELEESDPALYRIRLERMPIEDNVFALGWDIKTAAGTDKVNDLRAELRENLRKLVRSGLQERKLRLEHWQTVLDQHRRELKEDEQKIESAVERYMLDVQRDQWPRFLGPKQQMRRGRPADEQ